MKGVEEGVAGRVQKGASSYQHLEYRFDLSTPPYLNCLYKLSASKCSFQFFYLYQLLLHLHPHTGGSLIRRLILDFDLDQPCLVEPALCTYIPTHVENPQVARDSKLYLYIVHLRKI